MKNRWLSRIGIVAGLSAMATVASALMVDAQIMIDRALNSPTLTLRYSGTSAAMAELRINGKSVSTRTLTDGKTSGETNFNVDPTLLKDGDNEVEIRLFDRNGKQVGSRKIQIASEGANKGPVYLMSPKMGGTVQGPVEIRVGFGREMRNSYVSVFVNNQIKSMVNTPPFAYLWDTTREDNGWHEVEAWVIDGSSNTYKTRKVRVFVNNPGGRTERRTATQANVEGATNAIQANVSGASNDLRAVQGGKATAVTNATQPVTPKVAGIEAQNAVRGSISGATAGTKSTRIESSVMTGPKSLVPTGTRNAVVRNANVAKVPTVSVTNSVNSAAGTIAITKGQRLPNLASFTVVFNSQFVEFDVNPRVDQGVPMTPFRHLIEKAGGKVEWENSQKAVNAEAEGNSVNLFIGNREAKVNKLPVQLEIAPYLDRGRTIVPLSFLSDVLKVNIEYDRATGHVLITSVKGK
jgi:hypothetical protein